MPVSTANAGARYTLGSKEVEVVNIVAGAATSMRDCNSTFSDKESWSGFTPRIGPHFEPTERAQLYGHYARGFRSGGYNFRNVDTVVPPAPSISKAGQL